MKKNIFKFLILLILICPIFVHAEEYKYTKDEANLLKKSTKEYIDQYSEFIDEHKQVKYFVVTLKTLGMYELDEITDIYFEQLNIGKKGILILYVKDKKALQIKVGDHLSKLITNDVLQSHIDKYILPFLKNQEVDEGILNGYKSFYKIICNFYKIDSTDMIVYNADNFYEKYKSYIIMFMIWINSTTTYLICDIIKKFYIKNKKIKKKDQITFFVSIAVNIAVLFFAFYINTTTMLIILAFEFFAISSSYSTSHKLDLNEIKKIEYKKELKRQAKEKLKARKKEALRLKQLRKMQKAIKHRNKKNKAKSSDLDKMLNRTRHK